MSDFFARMVSTVPCELTVASRSERDDVPSLELELPERPLRDSLDFDALTNVTEGCPKTLKLTKSSGFRCRIFVPCLRTFTSSRLSVSTWAWLYCSLGE